MTTHRSVCATARASLPPEAGRASEPGQLPRRLAAVHAVPVAVHGVEHSLVQRRVRRVLVLIRARRVPQRLRRMAAVDLEGVQIGLAALPVGAPPRLGPDGDGGRLRVLQAAAVEHRVVHDPPQARQRASADTARAARPAPARRAAPRRCASDRSPAARRSSRGPGTGAPGAAPPRCRPSSTAISSRCPSGALLESSATDRRKASAARRRVDSICR